MGILKRVETIIVLVYLLYVDSWVTLEFEIEIGTRNVNSIFNCMGLKTWGSYRQANEWLCVCVCI